MQFHLTTQPTVFARRNKIKKSQLPKLGRGRQSREPKRRFILYCEGKKTEPQYFDALKRVFVNSLVLMDIVRGAGVPMTIAKKAIKHAKSEGLGRFKKSKDSFEKKDQIWAVFDHDEHPYFNDAVNDCKQNGIKVGRSNPCFELWLILHEQDYDAYQDRHQVQNNLGKIRSDYDPHGAKVVNFDEIVTRVEVAEERSKKQLENREKEGNPHGNPSTTIGSLTQAIRKAAELS